MVQQGACVQHRVIQRGHAERGQIGAGVAHLLDPFQPDAGGKRSPRDSRAQAVGQHPCAADLSHLGHSKREGGDECHRRNTAQARTAHQPRQDPRCPPQRPDQRTECQQRPQPCDQGEGHADTALQQRPARMDQHQVHNNVKPAIERDEGAEIGQFQQHDHAQRGDQQRAGHNACPTAPQHHQRRQDHGQFQRKQAQRAPCHRLRVIGLDQHQKQHQRSQKRAPKTCHAAAPDLRSRSRRICPATSTAKDASIAASNPAPSHWDSGGTIIGASSAT